MKNKQRLQFFYLSRPLLGIASILAVGPIYGQGAKFAYSEPVDASTEPFIAFMPEAFEAYMQPVPLQKDSSLEVSGVSVSYGETKKKTLYAFKTLGVNGAKGDSLFSDVSFDSPFHIAYQLEDFISEEFFVSNDSASGKSDEISFPPSKNALSVSGVAAGAYEKPQKEVTDSIYTLGESYGVFFDNIAYEDSRKIIPQGLPKKHSGVVLTQPQIEKINSELLFEHFTTHKVDPETFEFDGD
jgi:hypothetical protein